MLGKVTLKLVGFLVIMVWILAFLGGSLVIMSPVLDLLKSYYSTDWNSQISAAFVVWWAFTTVVLGTLVGRYGFLLVGKWEKGDKDEKGKEKV